MNIFQTIKQETKKFSAKTAVIEGSSKISYGKLISSAEEISSALKEKGVMPFHRVGLLCNDSIDYIAASLAVLSLSAVVVPISPEQTGSEITGILERMAVNFLVFEKGAYKDKGSRALQSKGFFQKEFFITKREVKDEPCEEYYKINPAFIRFSSGTTGKSKGVVLSHEAIIERTDAANKGLKITSGDNILWVLSMSFHFVVTILLFLRKGATIILCNNFFPKSLIEGITKYKGTFIYASPFHYSLVSRTESISGNALRHIRLAVSTAMKLPEQVAEEFLVKFGFELTEAYGVIEVGLPFIRLTGGRKKRGSVGKPLPDFVIALDNKGADGIGEIRIKGKGMLDAYYSPWRGRKNILTDGWFKTGDLGKIDNDGFLFIAGREKDVINFVGMKVFAQEVEAVLDQHPQVKESHVYGVAHSEYGELPMARVVLKGAGVLDGIALRRFCYQRMARYKVPKDFEFVEAIPRTASGKIRR
ncbi:MAG: hypothetical protein EPN94_00845 [Nitrospirae bacterium]|nr:MAG: hypothetical protein EPN94_00845 [Nitrospirota bacterium]